MAPACPACGFRFEREEGYWVGAIIVNMAVAEIWFAILFGTVVLLTLPDPAWKVLLIGGLVTQVVLAVGFYPYSKSLWMAMDLYWHPIAAPGPDPDPG